MEIAEVAAATGAGAVAEYIVNNQEKIAEVGAEVVDLTSNIIDVFKNSVPDMSKDSFQLSSNSLIELNARPSKPEVVHNPKHSILKGRASYRKRKFLEAMRTHPKGNYINRHPKMRRYFNPTPWYMKRYQRRGNSFRYFWKWY